MSNIFLEKKSCQRIICLLNKTCLTKVSSSSSFFFFSSAFHNVVRLHVMLQTRDKKIFPPQREEKQGFQSQLIRPCGSNLWLILVSKNSKQNFAYLPRFQPKTLHRICWLRNKNLTNFTLIQDICNKYKSKRAPALVCSTGMRLQWQALIGKKQLRKAKHFSFKDKLRQ